jgi:hypothetical protein
MVSVSALAGNAASEPATPDPTTVLVKSLPLDPAELTKPPGVTLFFKNVQITACLAGEEIKPIGEAPKWAESDQKVGAAKSVRVLRMMCEWALGGSAVRGSWKLEVFEANSSEDATAVLLYKGVWIANTKPKAAPQWEGKSIGEVSLGHFGSGIWGTTVFRRGNVVAAVIGGGFSKEQPLVDAAQLAAILDRYLTERPVLGAAAKPCDILLKDVSGDSRGEPVARLMEQRPYELAVDKMPAEAKGGELRFYVEQGAVTEKEDGTLHVTFTAPGKHKIWCYASDSKGAWVAAGEREVVVEAALGGSMPAAGGEVEPSGGTHE